MNVNALIVGADRVDSIRAEINRRAAETGRHGAIDHWDGRKAGDSRREIPNDTQLVVIVCDRASHMLMRSVRSQAQRRKIPVVFCRHSAIELRQRLCELDCLFNAAQGGRRLAS